MKCIFCTRQAVHVFDNAPPMCESCGKAYREGFEHGRVYESTRRRRDRAGPRGECVVNRSQPIKRL